ncbi:MAG: hypothetical protein M3400_02735 [Actinomycetota bacterium]|nr:hypothetical protein [Actinomycetota bacterium]
MSSVVPGRSKLLDRVRHLAAAAGYGWRRLEAGHDALFVQRWRAGVARERRRREDELLAVLFLDSVGVENPATYYALDVYPELLESLHRWHRSRGEDRFGDGLGCC